MARVARTSLALELGHRDLPNRVNVGEVCAAQGPQVRVVAMASEGLSRLRLVSPPQGRVNVLCLPIATHHASFFEEGPHNLYES